MFDLNCQWFLFTPNPEDSEMKTTSYYINYMHTNDRWTAIFKNNQFYHYKQGDPKQCHTDSFVAYQNENGLIGRLEIRNGKMFTGLHAIIPHLTEGKMTFVGWDNKLWTADLVNIRNFHTEQI